MSSGSSLALLSSAAGGASPSASARCLANRPAPFAFVDMMISSNGNSTSFSAPFASTVKARKSLPLLSSSFAVAASPLTKNNNYRSGRNNSIPSTTTTSRRRTIWYEMSLRSNNSGISISVENDPSSISSSSSPSSSSTSEEEREKAKLKKVGGRIKVTVPLKVYHIPRVPEVELTGKEGILKDYVALWKGKRISANLPYKVEFLIDLAGRGPVKFFAHLKEDEFEFLD